MFGNWGHLVYYDNIVKIYGYILFVFFYNDSTNVNLVLNRAQSLYGYIGTERLSRYVVIFLYLCLYVFYAGK